MIQEHQVILSLASNADQERNMSAARQRLSEMLRNLQFTSAHWTDPIGFSRPDKYLNQLAKGITTYPIDKLNECLKKIEQQLGRKHDTSGFVSIDIDLLQYDETRYHLRDWERSYVKDLLHEL